MPAETLSPDRPRSPSRLPWSRQVGPARARQLALLVRFGLVGLLNTLFGYAAFAALVLLGVWPGVALAAATLAGVAFNFQTARHLVFGVAGRPLRFVAVYAVVLALNVLALHALERLGASALTAQALLALPVAALSFMGQRRFVFLRGGTA